MIEWYKKVVFENYANFNGRARRSEYWYFVLMNMIISTITMMFDKILGIKFGVNLLYGIAVFIPTLSVSVRRLHDIGKSGWILLISYITIIICAVGLVLGMLTLGTSSFNIWFTIPIIVMVAICIWMLVLFVTEGNDGKNKYGSDPKNIFDEDDEIDEIGTAEA
ncbi:Uncharacterized membrane protein YhaH, DUF805 family [Flavobacterium fluvii]|uniref:Uncharacterized membrane protein YhaH, DUF805 family n=1 Tax=Flavobacterium fluvii TaxID=468056 RepID=A0A1M5F9Z2_9FLAO|nr:DUF805 domain-containing protein [Flavobacterium fluvii]SHF88337.1 Uncharacterized membrane protein YhaH, DUF805 family [Flavobacterium fluvii]